MFVGVVTLRYEHSSVCVVLMAQCHNSYKHSQSPLTMYALTYYQYISLIYIIYVVLSKSLTTKGGKSIFERWKIRFLQSLYN